MADEYDRGIATWNAAMAMIGGISFLCLECHIPDDDSVCDDAHKAPRRAAASWPEAAAKARYVLNLYAAELPPDETHHRDLVAVFVADFARLSAEINPPVAKRR